MASRCVIAGGGPAGMMLGLLLGRAGIDVQVFEKHRDFLRDFRGDTIHPSTMEVMYELGLLERFLKLPHQEVVLLHAQIGDTRLALADFGHLPTHCRFIAFMPQWDFLDFIAEEARRLPTFRLEMATEVTGILEAGDRVTGVRVAGADGGRDVPADLVVAADGRHSMVRAAARLPVEELGAPMDVLWFRLPRSPDSIEETMGRFDLGRILVTINRGDYWQCGYIITKGSFERVHAQGIEAFRTAVAAAAPFAVDLSTALRSWNEVSLLTVVVDRLTTWYRPGLLCIGDAAHAMSPVGGVGINLAIQDAVATANLLSEPLRSGRLTVDDLRSVQKRREFPTRLTQWAQVQIQKNVIEPVLRGNVTVQPPLAARLLSRFPILRRIPARLVGLGVRPEHVADVHPR